MDFQGHFKCLFFSFFALRSSAFISHLPKWQGFQLLTQSTPPPPHNVHLESGHVCGSCVSLTLSCRSTFAFHMFPGGFLEMPPRSLLKGLAPQIRHIPQGFTSDTNIWFALLVFLFVLRKWGWFKKKKSWLSSPGLDVCQSLVRHRPFKFKMRNKAFSPRYLVFLMWHEVNSLYNNFHIHWTHYVFSLIHNLAVLSDFNHLDFPKAKLTYLTPLPL